MKLLSRYLSCTYLAHHELESVFIIIIIIIIVIIIIIIIIIIINIIVNVIIIIIIVVIVVSRYGVPALTPSGPL